MVRDCSAALNNLEKGDECTKDPDLSAGTLAFQHQALNAHSKGTAQLLTQTTLSYTA